MSAFDDGGVDDEEIDEGAKKRKIKEK
jgi:hypothetical protein